MQNQTKPEPSGAPMAKLILVVAIIVCLGAVAGVAGYCLTKKKPIVSPTPKTISAIEISADKKSILNSETKEVIFTINDAQKYLKNSGYAYDPNTFQTTNAKHAGDCFFSAVLSNAKNRIINNNTVKGSIVFSTGCLSGDLLQAWIGIYNFGIKELTLDCALAGKSCINDKQDLVLTSDFQFLIGGSGKNFVWSADDKTIAYEADLGLSGITEMRTIDAGTGEIIKFETIDRIEEWKDLLGSFDYIIKYPFSYFVKLNWITSPSAEEGVDVITNTENPAPQDILEPIRLDIYRYQNTGNKSIDLLYKEEIEFGEKEKSITKIPIDIKVEKIDIGKEKAVKVVKKWQLIQGENKPYEQSIFVYLIKSNYIYALRGNITQFANQSEFDALVDIMNKMQKSFVFINEDEANDWKTYRNEEFGFEFKYPSILVLEEKNDEQAGWRNISVFMKSDDFNGYILVNSAGIGTGFGIDISLEDIKIDNISAKLEILDSSVDNERAAKVSFDRNNNEYFWLYRFDKENSDKTELSKRIFSTFKFTEPEK